MENEERVDELEKEACKQASVGITPVAHQMLEKEVAKRRERGFAATRCELACEAIIKIYGGGNER